MRELIVRLMTPDDFAGDPAGYLTNQAGHFLIGALLAWPMAVLGWWALAVVAVIYALVEVAQARFGNQTLHDAAEDWIFVMLGAGWVLGLLLGNALFAFAVAAGLGATGIWRRL